MMLNLKKEEEGVSGEAEEAQMAGQDRNTTSQSQERFGIKLPPALLYF